jgi:signal transduction histidine kinase
LFETLCLDVLEVQQAVLVPAGTLATLAGPPLLFPEGTETSLPPLNQHAALFNRQVRCLPAAQLGLGPGADWAVPLWSSRGLDGVLYLKEKSSRNPFSEEEIEIAQTAGERLLDLLAGAEMARLAMDLLGQRLAQARVMDGQGRRVLHDEVLPELHTALLYLSEDPPAAEEKQLAMDALARAHRRIARLMREMPLPAPHHLTQSGLGAALQAMLEEDFAGQFSTVSLEIQPEAAQKTREMPLYISEALFFAARELVRNAAAHGRGEEPRRELCLQVRFTLEGGLRLVIDDNGIGYQPEPEPASDPARGSGSGLRIHSAILAAVGAGLEVTARPEGGTRAVITVYS